MACSIPVYVLHPVVWPECGEVVQNSVRRHTLREFLRGVQLIITELDVVLPLSADSLEGTGI